MQGKCERLQITRILPLRFGTLPWLAIGSDTTSLLAVRNGRRVEAGVEVASSVPHHIGLVHTQQSLCRDGGHRIAELGKDAIEMLQHVGSGLRRVPEKSFPSIVQLLSNVAGCLNERTNLCVA